MPLTLTEAKQVAKMFSVEGRGYTSADCTAHWLADIFPHFTWGIRKRPFLDLYRVTVSPPARRVHRGRKGTR